MTNRMNWEEIKQKYPHQYVGLIDVKYGVNNVTIENAVVKYTSSDLSYNELIDLYLQGEILLRYTTLDEDDMRCVMDDTKKEIEMTPELSRMHNDSINRIKEKYAYLFNDKSLLGVDENDMRFVMDETSVPYEHNENPFQRTASDDEFEKMIINKYQLITKEIEKVL